MSVELGNLKCVKPSQGSGVACGSGYHKLTVRPDYNAVCWQREQAGNQAAAGGGQLLYSSGVLHCTNTNIPGGPVCCLTSHRVCLLRGHSGQHCTQRYRVTVQLPLLLLITVYIVVYSNPDSLPALPRVTMHCSPGFMYKLHRQCIPVAGLVCTKGHQLTDRILAI